PRFLAWRIMELLPSFLDDPRFVALRNYLGEPVHNLKLLQLSERIANTFDQYTVYRPEFITDWNSGKGDEWQAVLWRGLSEGHEHENRAVLGRMLLSRLDTAAVAGPNGYGEGSGWSEVLEGQGRTGEFALPHRVSVFGISYLPPFHIQVLQSLSRLTEVNLFVLNPCREYWGNITAERQIGRIAFGTGSGSLSAEDLHLESGNSLLASMGKLGRDFFGLITSFDCEEYSSFEPPGESDLLSCIRSDILDLKESREATGSPVSVAASDRSVEIHSCHGPMREVEVLYDHLLEMFESIPSLAPRDIVVMAPDIELYAPLVQAVFDSPGEEKMRVPYNIADRSVRKESNVINAFLSILDLWGERITASKVMGILESEQVRRRFEISDEDLDLILKWVGEVRIKWGLDEKEKLKWCRTAYRENTWMAGIERLLLGYAMPGRDRNTFCGILPYDHLEGSETLVLGNFLNFLHHLFGLLESVERPRTLTDWDQLLLGMISDFFIEDEDSRDEIQALRRAIGDLRRIRKVSGYSGELDMPVMKWYLSRFAGGESFGHGFLTGGVTFCSMLPMRSIPFKVVCLIGMNENAFPRQSKPLEFDLMAKDPRPGDRSLRNDDRYLFLEALISAETRLYISYTGQSSRDNSVMPPSVLVSELMDYIRKNFRKENSGDETWFLTRHRLQPFNPAYFTGDSKLFSYSDEHLAQACSLTRDKREPADFISDGLPPADESMRTVSVADLRRFFSNPAKFLLNR
ncbi:MAG: exodeoxyribonuclease V subunit gamma, partial [Syntrophobacteraceae bacterium]